MNVNRALRKANPRDVAALLALILLVAIQLHPMWSSPHSLQSEGDVTDAQTELGFTMVITDAFKRHNEWALWNPYYGGGFPISGTHGHRAYSLWIVPLLLSDEIIAIKLMVSLFFILAAVGTYGFCRSVVGVGHTASFAGGCRIHFEEQALKEQFGGEYEKYRSDTPMWLPFLHF